MMLSFTVLFSVALVLRVVAAQDVKCSHLHLIYARATMEAKGYGAAGGSLITELKKLVPTVTTYAVDYPVGAALSTLNRISAKARVLDLSANIFLGLLFDCDILGKIFLFDWGGPCTCCR
ncbi:hypothetical protein Vi05172_g12784 [Venturia inaequalis]|nr:hypothetical protein Vi05172_g12784 [Venturia inaequalis]